MSEIAVVSRIAPKATRAQRSDIDKLMDCAELRHLKTQLLAERISALYTLRFRLDLFYSAATAKKAECWIMVRSVAKDSSTLRDVGSVEEWEVFRTEAGAEAAWKRRDLHLHLWDDLAVPLAVRRLQEFP